MPNGTARGAIVKEGFSTLRKQKRKIQRAPQELSAERILNIHAVNDSQPSVVRQRAVFTVLCATLNVHDVGLRHWKMAPGSVPREC